MKWPAVITIVLDIIVTTAHWNVSLTWLFLILLTMTLGVAVATSFRGSLGNAAGAGLAAGLIVGVFTSVFRFLWFRTIESFFEIVTTSLLSLLVALLMSTSAYLVLARRAGPKRRSHQQ